MRDDEDKSDGISHLQGLYNNAVLKFEVVVVVVVEDLGIVTKCKVEKH